MANFVYSKVLPASTTADADDVNQNFDDVRNFALSKTLHRDGSPSMTAPLSVPFDPSSGNHAVRKSYLDARTPVRTVGASTGTNSFPNGSSAELMTHTFTTPAQAGLLLVDMRLYLACQSVTTGGPITAIAYIQSGVGGTFSHRAITRVSAIAANQEQNLACSAQFPYPSSTTMQVRCHFDVTGASGVFNTLGDTRFTYLLSTMIPSV